MTTDDRTAKALLTQARKVQALAVKAWENRADSDLDPQLLARAADKADQLVEALEELVAL